MISDAYVDFECDTCGDLRQVTLPVVFSSYSGSDPHVDLRDRALAKLLPNGWVMDGDHTYCENCKECR